MRRAQGRREAEEQRGRERHAGGESEDAEIEVRLQHDLLGGTGQYGNQE
jgi:hypothetical protein